MKSMNELVEWFQLTYPKIVLDMMNCSHHYTKLDAVDLENIIDANNLSIEPLNINPYHIEGDVWAHTMQVCKQAENEPYLVKLAALLHDIGKPDTRMVNPKNNRVGFFNHDAVGAFKALEILNQPYLELTNEQKVHVFELIALHTQVFKQTPDQLKKLFVGKQDLIDDFIRLGKCDSDGRFTSIPSLTYTNWINVGNKENVNKEKQVIILCGLPGVGKSTWVRNNFEGTNKNYSIISRDFIVEQEEGSNYNEKWKNADQNKIEKELLLRFKDVIEYPTVTTIVDMTHMSKKSRRKSLSHFGSEYKKKCVLFLPDLPKNYLQNNNRTGKIISKKVIDKMMTSFSPPMLDEFDEIEYIL